jgi:hypothetical protein
MSINFKDMAKSIVDNYADLMLPSTDRLDELEFMILQGFLAIKDELMRMVPEEKDGGFKDMGFENHETAYVDGHNDCRALWLAAIAKIGEEV